MRRLVGIHAVAAAIRSAREEGGGIDEVVVAKGTKNRRLEPLIAECRSLGIPIRFQPRAAIQRLTGVRAHQDIMALAPKGVYQPLDSVLDEADQLCTLVVLDSVQDPRNLGAILRTADGADAAAVVVPERRSASLTDAAAKAAAGAQESVPVARVKNLGRALEEMKQAGFWVLGFDSNAENDYDLVAYPDRCALVFGGESRGLRPKVAERCDHLVRIPLRGIVSSLNVSVAAGIALFEVQRQRRERDGPEGNPDDPDFIVE